MPFVVVVLGTVDGPDPAVPPVLDGSEAVVDVVLRLVRRPGSTVGVGAGPAGAGPGAAAPAARRALEAARRRPARLAVRGAEPAEAADAQAVLTALAGLVQRRSAQAWEAIELVRAGRTQARAAAALGISRQAVGQRLLVAQWEVERDLRCTAARLLDRAAG
ncbi:hypothetical protein ACI8AC_09315 [Geodermatophilus sp. SYSU D00758]